MKLNYYPDTDSLYIDLSEQPSTESREISEGIVLDYDANGNLVGIDIDNASRKVDLKQLTLRKLPSVIQNLSASFRPKSNGVEKVSGAFLGSTTRGEGRLEVQKVGSRSAPRRDFRRGFRDWCLFSAPLGCPTALAR